SLCARTSLVVCCALAAAIAAPCLTFPSQGDVIAIRPDEIGHATMPPGDPKAMSLVFELVADETGPLTIEARSLDFDTSLELARLESDGSMKIVSKDDDGGIGTNSLLVIHAKTGDRFRINVR